MIERPNYYILLGLDPSVDDSDVIDQHLRTCRTRWSRDVTQGAPARKRKAQRYLEQLSRMHAVLQDPESRRDEARAARRVIEQERIGELAALDRQIGLLRAGGQCSRKQLATLCKRAKTLAAKEIEERIVKAGVRLEGRVGAASTKPTRKAPERIDPVVQRALRGNLDAVGKRDLYEFVGLTARSSLAALQEEAERAGRELQRVGGTDAHSTASKELVGICQTLFADTTARQRYDNTLAVQALDTLQEPLELVGADKGFLGAAEVDTLVRLAREQGVPADRARQHIEDYAAKRKWGVQTISERLEAEILPQCGFCSELAPSREATRCRRCGEPLAQDCPRCGAPTPTDRPACPKCGCDTRDAPLVRRLLKEGQDLAAQGALLEGMRCLERALVHWPDWEPARRERFRMAALREQRDRELATIEEAVNARHLQEAQGDLDRYRRLHGSDGTERLWRCIEEGLRRAHGLLADARRLRGVGQADAALERFEEALRSCADLREAKQAIAAHPPEPPTRLHVTELPGGFRLAWNGAAGKPGLEYRVIRKACGRPGSWDDGTVVGEPGSPGLDDLGPEPGVPWYYAVYTSRSGVRSVRPAHSGPHVLADPPAKVEVVAGEGTVTLRWALPRAAKGVDLRRRRGRPPHCPEDGYVVAAARSSAVDSGLRNGTRYGYLLRAVYDDPRHSGALVYSAGVKVSAVPSAPPPPVLDLQGTCQGQRVALSWTHPAPDAEVQLRRAPRAPATSPGTVLASDTLDELGALVPPAGRGHARASLAEQGRTFFVPVTLRQGAAVLGQAISLTNLREVDSLRGERSGTNLVLTWNWPSGVNEARVCYRSDCFPTQPGEPGTTCALVTRREYDRRGCWELRAAARQRHYFSVHTLGEEAGLHSTGVRCLMALGREHKVRYELVPHRWMGLGPVRSLTLELSCDAALGELPPTVLVAKRQHLPLSPTDGETVATYGPTTLTEGRASLPVPREHGSPTPERYVKLFLRQADLAKEISLMAAPKDRLRLV